MWESILHELWLQQNVAPSRDGDVVGEVIGYRAVLDPSHQQFFLSNARRRLSAAYAAAETLWYLSGRNDVAMLARYAPSYIKFADERGLAYGGYGPRIMPQLDKVIEQMKKQLLTRQAVLAVWSQKDLDMIGKTPDLPCTLSLQFLLRDGALHCVTTMRSNDVWRGMPYDVFAFCCLQRVVAAHLDARVGLYYHQAGSMHLYARDAQKAREALTGEARVAPHKLDWNLDDTLSSTWKAVTLERESRIDGVERSDAALGDMGRALLSACRRHLKQEKDAWRISSFETEK